jgi:hypothetical protein
VLLQAAAQVSAEALQLDRRMRTVQMKPLAAEQAAHALRENLI